MTDGMPARSYHVTSQTPPKPRCTAGPASFVPSAARSWACASAGRMAWSASRRYGSHSSFHSMVGGCSRSHGSSCAARSSRSRDLGLRGRAVVVRVEGDAVLDGAALGQEERHVDAVRRAVDDARQERELAVREQGVALGLRPLVLQPAERLEDQEGLVDGVHAERLAVDRRVHGLAAQARVRRLARDAHREPQEARRDRHDRQRVGRREGSEMTATSAR